MKSNPSHPQSEQLLTEAVTYSPPWKMFLLLLVIAGGFVLLRKFPLNGLIDDTESIRRQILGMPPLLGISLFVFGGGALTVIGLPRLVLSGLGGFVFGVWAGTALALVGTVFGCVLSFYFARLMGQEFFQDRLTIRVRNIQHLLLKRPFLVSLLIRNLPIANNSITNLLAGISSIQALPYFVGSMIAYIPQTLIFAVMGAGVQQDEFHKIVLGILIFLATAGLTWYLFRVLQSVSKQEK